MRQLKHIFISYRSSEAEFAIKLATDLRNFGISVWLDRLDGIHVAEDWRRAIEQALKEATGLIAVLSPEYINSRYCLRELATADEIGIPILPILLRSIPLEDRPIEIRRLQYIDFQQWQDHSQYLDFLNNLISTIRQKGIDQFCGMPEPETRYLNQLVGDLEARRGVLEYIELNGETDEANSRLLSYLDREDEFGFSELISELEQQPLKAKISIREAVEKHQRFIIVGEPGSSKTTTLRRLALEAARKRLGDPLAPLPFLLYLPQWGDELSAQDFVRVKWHQANLGQHTDPISMLSSGNMVLYLDGLNEMGEKGVKKATLLKEWLQSNNSLHKIIITCRKDQYTLDYDLKIPIVHIEPMNDLQIQSFVKNYLHERAEAFMIYVEQQNRDLISLMRNPYMLSALIIAFDYSANEGLPSNTFILFKKIVRALANRETKRFSIGWLPIQERYPIIEHALAKLASSMFDKGTMVSLEDARQHLDDDILKAACSASFLEIIDNKVRFYHQLLQEFFVAVDVIIYDAPLQISPQTIFRGQQFYSRAGDDAALMIAKIHKDPDLLLNSIMHDNMYTAFKVLVEIEKERKISQATKDALTLELISRAQKWSNFKSFPEYKEWNDILTYGRFAGVLDPWDYLAKRENLRIFAIRIVIKICEFFEYLQSPLSIPLLISILYNDDLQEAQYASASTLIKINIDEEVMTLTNWKQRQIKLLSDPNPRVRKSAALSVGYFEMDKAIPILAELLKDNAIENPLEYIKSHYPSLVNLDEEPWYQDQIAPPVSYVAAMALEQIGTEEALTALKMANSS
jgi:TIR domain/NACHT domain/HEAT repeats